MEHCILHIAMKTHVKSGCLPQGSTFNRKGMNW